MRYILTIWALPLAIFWGWFGLSYYDMNFGYLMLSRQIHDIYFQLAGQIMGVDPATVPWLIAKACILDTLILVAIWAFRRRREIVAWLRRQRERYSGQSAAPDSPSA
ncbi:DUF6105 family protein [Mesorhizobium sp. ASY16-5R]|uniref:DUF6105 family protein n=1 Tax=Mesorhizobium sp. ASY16-5R TaxID=3445772 RepID=UPI003FA04DCA